GVVAADQHADQLGEQGALTAEGGVDGLDRYPRLGRDDVDGRAGVATGDEQPAGRVQDAAAGLAGLLAPADRVVAALSAPGFAARRLDGVIHSAYPEQY